MSDFFKIIVVLGVLTSCSDKHVKSKDIVFRVGNGGAGVVCKNPVSNKATVQFFDVYEANKKNKPLVIQQSKEEMIENTVTDLEGGYNRLFLSTVLKNIKELDRSLYDYLYANLISFNNRIESFSSEEFKLNKFYQTEDLYSDINLPAECEIKQVIVQYKNEESGVPEYYIHGALYNKMDSLNKTVAVLHEVIYGYFIDHGLVGDSRPIRNLVQLAFKDYSLMKECHATEGWSQEALDLCWWDKQYEVQKAYFEIMQSSGGLKVTPPAWMLQSIGVVDSSVVQEVKVILDENFKMEYCPDSKINLAKFENYPIKSLMGSEELSYVSGGLEFDCDTRTVLKIIDLDKPLEVLMQDQLLVCSRTIELNEKGEVLSCDKK